MKGKFIKGRCEQKEKKVLQSERGPKWVATEGFYAWSFVEN